MILKFSRLFCPKKTVLFNVLANPAIKCNFCSDTLDKNIQKKVEYLLILDFEATCDKKKMIQEVIEFPCLKINLTNLQEEGRFHHYVRPVINPVLTNFCVELTGILQEMVDGEKTFPEVLQLFTEWREKEGLTDENSLYVTSGDWDLGSMMPKQCQASGLDVPSHMKQWIDIKKLYGSFTGQYSESLIQIIKAYGMEFEGRQHSGIADCLNIYNVVKKIAKLGGEFKPTSKLVCSEHRWKIEILLPQSNRFEERRKEATPISLSKTPNT